MSRFADLADHIRQHSKEIGASPRIGIDIPGLSEAFSLGDAFSSDTTTFTDEITGSPAITRSISRLGGLSVVSSLKFAVNNQDLFSDIFASGTSPNPENEEVNVYLYFDDGTAILDAEREKLFSGIISNFPELDYDQVFFRIDSQEILLKQTIGTLLTDSDAADSGIGLPEISQGKIKPIIYGDHTFLKGNNSKSLDTTASLNNLVPSVYLGVDSSDNHRWLVAGHRINEINTHSDDADQQQIWGLDPDINRFVRLATEFTVEQNTADGCIISHPNNPNFYDYIFPTGRVTSTKNGADTGNANVFSPLTDITSWDFAEKATASFVETAATTTILLSLEFAAYDNQGLTDDQVIGIKGMTYIKSTAADGATAADYTTSIGSALDAIVITDPESGANPGTRNETTFTTNTLANVGVGGVIKIQLDNNLLAGESITIDVYQYYQQLEYQPLKLIPLYFGGKGQEYGSYINDRSTSEDNFTETHADNETGLENRAGTAIGLIENGAGVIEDLFRNEINIVEENLGAELLNETGFATHAKWDTTGKCDDTGGKAEWTFAGGTLNGNLTQTAANRAGAGTNLARYRFTFTLATTVTPDGDAYLELFGSRFNDNQTIIMGNSGAIFGTGSGWLADGIHFVEFQAASDADVQSLVIRCIETTSTVGQFSIDNVSLKEVTVFDLDSFNVASNDLFTTVLSFSIIEQVDFDILVDDILKTLGSIVTYTNEDQIRMRTFVSGDGFGVSGVGSPVAEDIWEFDPQQSFLVITGENDRFRYTDSDPALYDIQITAGGYTGDGLAAAIETAMDAVSTPDMTCTYNSTTGEFTISDAGGNFTLTWDFFSASLADLLGFNSGVNNTGAASYTSTVPVWADSFIEHPIAEVNGFSLRKSQDPIITDVTVNYFLSPTTNAYQSTSNTSDVTKHAETIKGTFNNNYTQDQTTAEFHRDFLIARLFKKFYHGIINGPTANLSPIGVEGWDFVNLRHPVLNGILGSGEETQKWLLLRESLALKSLTMSIEAEQV